MPLSPHTICPLPIGYYCEISVGENVTVEMSLAGVTIELSLEDVIAKTQASWAKFHGQQLIRVERVERCHCQDSASSTTCLSDTIRLLQSSAHN